MKLRNPTLALSLLVLTAGSANADTITLSATVRDFQISHPDFEDGISGLVTGLVNTTLAPDKNPVFAAAPGTGAITSAATFAQWYDDVPGVNQTTNINLTVPDDGVFPDALAGDGIFTFGSAAYFPIDGQLWGNEGNSHNYHFTLEAHTTFTYQLGQVFTFVGDDDIWVFINNQLAIDLGGVHTAAFGSVNLDTLGLTAGNTYDWDFYFAERHTSQSNFLMSTSIPLESTAPEPMTLSLLGLGAAAFGRREWKRRSSRA